ncbi:MAG: hypothetical protein Q9217_001172 [Psora testacea]
MTENSNSSTENPSMIHGHAAYVAAAAKNLQVVSSLISVHVKETLGSYTSTDMQTAGSAEKQAALDEMRAAKAQSDAQGGDLTKNTTLGKVEQTLGSATGCEGMAEEEQKRQS